MALRPPEVRAVSYQPRSIPSHEEAWERCLYVAAIRGIGWVSGPSGCGKSRLLLELRTELSGEGFRVHLFDSTGWTAEEFPLRIAASMGLNLSASSPLHAVWQGLNDYLHPLRHMGHRQILLLDHLDRCAAGCAGVVDRLLTLCQGSLTCIVAARPVLDPGLEGVLRRYCGLRIELTLLRDSETHRYLDAGGLGLAGPRFSDEALREIQALSGGELRSIDRLAALGLTALEVEEGSTVSAEMVRAAASELYI